MHYDSAPFDVFKAALPDTVRWCQRRAGTPGNGSLTAPDPALRSMELCPSLFSFGPAPLVWSVVNARRNSLGTSCDAVPDSVQKPGGRLLYFDPSTTLSDGAALVQSQGFFDNDNVPPWDTWLCFSDDGFVVSWVPPGYLDRVDAGVEANPERCIMWAHEADTPFTSLLRTHGLL